MYIALTRPNQDNETFIRKANFLPHRFINVPLLKIKNISQYKNIKNINNILNADCITFTSSNAIKALVKINQKNNLIAQIKHKTLFVIGNASGVVANKYGFSNVIKADGTVEGLVNNIKQFQKNYNNNKINVAYLSGQQISVNLEEQIQKIGATCQRFIIYEACEVENITKQLFETVKNKKLAAAVIFSPRTAEIWKKKITLGNMQKYIENITYFCLSKKIAKVLNNIKYNKILVTKYNDADDMIKLLAKHFDDIRYYAKK